MFRGINKKIALQLFGISLVFSLIIHLALRTFASEETYMVSFDPLTDPLVFLFLGFLITVSVFSFYSYLMNRRLEHYQKKHSNNFDSGN